MKALRRFIYVIASLALLSIPFVGCKSTSADDPEVHTVMVNGTEVRTDGVRAIEPEGDIDLGSARLSDFGRQFSETYEVTCDSYTLMEGQITQTKVVHIHSDNPGPCVYIVGAVHGDERAAWYAATLLCDITISRGDLYILVPANSNGARNLSRYVTGEQDLNRSFPGKVDGNEAEQLANAIFLDIDHKRPGVVLDLHEAIMMSNNGDFLGSTFIFTDLAGMEDLFLDMIQATEEGLLCHNVFGVNGPGPKGSVNAEVTRGLGIPTITVETFRGYDILRRVSDQLDIVLFVLSHMGMR